MRNFLSSLAPTRLFGLVSIQKPMAEPDQEAGQGRAAAGGGVLVQQEEVPGVRRGAQQRHAHHRQVS